MLLVGVGRYGVQRQSELRRVARSDSSNLGRILMNVRLTPGVFVVLALVAVGCTSSSGGDDSTTTTQAATTTTAAASTTTQAPTTSTVVQAELAIVEVEAYDYGFRGLPSEIVAGIPMTLANTSSTEYHNLVAFQLDADDVRSDEEIIEDYSTRPLAAFEDEAKQSVAGWMGELHARPGERSAAKLRLLSPGRYVFIDLVPQGADPDTAAANESGGQPYKIEGGPPGYHHGMIAVLTVTSE
jgi:hypothetical protein